MRIRPATAADAVAIVDLHFAAVHRTAAPFYSADILDSWSRQPDEERYQQLRETVAAGEESNRYDTVRQLVHSLHRYEEYGPDGVLTRTSLHQLELSYLYPPDLRRLLQQAGFASIHMAGGFDGRPFIRDTDELVIEARLG